MGEASNEHLLAIKQILFEPITGWILKEWKGNHRDELKEQGISVEKLRRDDVDV